MASDTVRRRVVVDGHVQGVFFRDSCRRQAAVIGVAGWARNLGDGRVEVVAEGPTEAVERMVAWCSAGPPHASVTGIEVAEEQAEGLREFSVR